MQDAYSTALSSYETLHHLPIHFQHPMSYGGSVNMGWPEATWQLPPSPSPGVHMASASGDALLPASDLQSMGSFARSRQVAWPYKFLMHGLQIQQWGAYLKNLFAHAGIYHKLRERMPYPMREPNLKWAEGHKSLFWWRSQLIQITIS